MQLTHAQQLAWLSRRNPPQTSREALLRLAETLRVCMEALEAGQLVNCQDRLEDSLLALLLAMHTFDLNPEAALDRAFSRMQCDDGRRAFHLFEDRLEIRVGDEVRGGWPLSGEADAQAACRLARELGCDIVYEEAAQLALFNA